MIRTRSLSIAAGIAAALVIGTAGCGGGGGGGGSAPGGGGGNGGALSASMTLLGGDIPFHATPVAAGSTTDVQLADASGNLHTITSVYSPDGLDGQFSSYCTVIRAGSVLLAGHYTSTTAKYIDATENFSSTIPLTATGAFVKDTIIPYLNGVIILPIDKIGNYSFPNGITVTFNTGSNDFSVQNNTLAFTATIPGKGNPVPNAGQMTFTDTGTVSPQAAMILGFESADNLSGVTIQTPSSTNASSPVPLQGYAAGSTTAMASAAVYYDLID